MTVQEQILDLVRSTEHTLRRAGQSGEDCQFDLGYAKALDDVCQIMDWERLAIWLEAWSGQVAEEEVIA